MRTSLTCPGPTSRAAIIISCAKRPPLVSKHGNGGGGVQVEGLLSYFVTNNISLGVGGRYWAMWTKKEADCGNGCGSLGFANYSMERWGTFFQASYKLN